MAESHLTRAVLTWCKRQEFWALKLHGSIYQRRGLPDLLILVPVKGLPFAVPLFVELKQPGNKPTSLQEKVLRDVTQAGAATGVATTLGEVQALVDRVHRHGFWVEEKTYDT